MLFWIIIFILSLALLVKSADWFIESSEKIGLALRLSPFIIGVTIVAIGTSLPELVTSLFATFKGATEIVSANVIGSNITNILLVVGLAAVVGRKLIVRRSLIDLDTPLLALTTILFILVMWDRVIILGEGILLLLAFVIYLLYTIFRTRESEIETLEMPNILPSRAERRKIEELRRLEASRGIVEIEEKLKKPLVKLDYKVFTFLIIGIIGLVVGAKYTIDSMIEISVLLNISNSLMAITALAIGTSLPELVVSVKAAAQKKFEIALGNIFGSNVFNVLLIIGIPALIRPIVVDELTFTIGLPFLVVATFVFIVSTIVRKIYIWEGLMFLLIYILFIAKLTGLF